ncbi:MAG TPA: ATP-binding protein, partial [Gemmatimonadaceae bacterium]|nr:ATP-binding protein [Gemmatimonadaceae bacterium]
MGLNVPRQYADASFKGFALYGSDAQRLATRSVVEMGKRYVREWPTRYEATSAFQHLVVLQGGHGTGKTRMCWTIARNLVQLHGASVLFTTLADMIRCIRAAWRKDSEMPESAVLARYQAPELLIVD